MDNVPAIEAASGTVPVPGLASRPAVAPTVAALGTRADSGNNHRSVSTECQQVWTDCLSVIANQIPSQSYKTWFDPIVPVKLERGNLTVQVPNQFFYEWIESHYADLIQQTITQVVGEDGRLLYAVTGSNGGGAPVQQGEASPRVVHRADDDTQLNPRYTFENFIEGAGNQFAKAAALAVAEAPGKTNFNPLLVYGGVGLGKTHLVQAIGNFARAERKARKILYVSSEKFTIEFISAIQNHSAAEFSTRYRGVDLLLVDDVQFFIDKERTQEEFFHTFNTLHQKGKQIVLSCDRPLGELKGLEDRLVSRFHSGLVVDIQAPDLETRMAILQSKAAEEKIRLAPEITEYIATHITSNIRELEGALIRLLAYASLKSKPLNLDLCRDVLKDYTRVQVRTVSIEQIQKMVSKYFRIPEDLLRAKTRKQEAVAARMVSMYLAKRLTNSSLKTIGLLHGGKDHSTVIHAIRTVEHQMGSDPAQREIVEGLHRKIEYM